MLRRRRGASGARAFRPCSQECVSRPFSRQTKALSRPPVPRHAHHLARAPAMAIDRAERTAAGVLPVAEKVWASISETAATLKEE